MLIDSLNVDKTKLIIFHSKQAKNPDNMIIKLNGSKLLPSEHVKYLGVYIDQYLSWDLHVNQLSKKLSRANGVLSKLRHFVPKNTLISVYYAIFYSHMIYGCSVWSLTTKKNLDIINVLQKKCLRIMNFAEFNSHTNPYFISNSLLKFEDIIETSQLQLIFDFNNRNLPDDLYTLFENSENIHNYVYKHVTQTIREWLFLLLGHVTLGLGQLSFLHQQLGINSLN